MSETRGANGTSFGERWLIDSGASVHVTNNKELLFNVRTATESVTVGNGQEAKATLKGNVILKNELGSGTIKLKDVLYIKDFYKNIMSVPRLMKNGSTMQWSDGKVKLSQNGKDISIEREKDETMFYLTAQRMPGENSTVMNVSKTMDVNEAHEKLAHMSEGALRKTMKKLGVELTGHMRPCDGCMRAKAKAKAVPKLTTVKDTTGPFKPSVGGSTYDVKLVDQYSRKTWGVRVKKKSMSLRSWRSTSRQ